MYAVLQDGADASYETLHVRNPYPLNTCEPWWELAVGIRSLTQRPAAVGSALLVPNRELLWHLSWIAPRSVPRAKLI